MVTPLILYGYTITIPEDDSIAFIEDMLSMNDMLEEPIRIYSITATTASDCDIELIIGFIPDAILSNNMEHYNILHDLITDNPMFSGIDIASSADFYTGFTWNRDDTSSVSDDCESSHGSTDCDSSDGSTNCESSDESVNSEESDDCIHDETDDKSLSDYISKYYI
jgi:hypothetical protein